MERLGGLFEVLEDLDLDVFSSPDSLENTVKKCIQSALQDVLAWPYRIATHVRMLTTRQGRLLYNFYH